MICLRLPWKKAVIKAKEEGIPNLSKEKWIYPEKGGIRSGGSSPAKRNAKVIRLPGNDRYGAGDKKAGTFLCESVEKNIFREWKTVNCL